MDEPSSAESVMTTRDLKKFKPFASMVLMISFAWACCSSEPLGVTSTAKYGVPLYIFQVKLSGFGISSIPRKITCGIVFRESKFLIMSSSD